MKILNRIEAHLENPKAAKNKLAVLLPGYLDNCNYDHLVLLSKKLAENGYTAIRFNPTGTWESAGVIRDYCASQYLKDVNDVIDWTEQDNGKEFDKVIIAGHSFGGQIALQYGLTSKNVDAAIGIMPAFGKFEEDDVTQKWRETGFRRSERKMPDSEERKVYRVPYSFLKDRRKYPTEALYSSTCPKLFITGELDDAVPADMVKRHFDSFSEPKKYVELKNIGHDYRLDAGEIAELNEVVLKFLLRFEPI